MASAGGKRGSAGSSAGSSVRAGRAGGSGAGKQKQADWLPFALAGGAATLFLGAILWLWFGYAGQEVKPAQQVVQIQVFRPPPPEEEPEPPPPQEQEPEEVDIPEPESLPDMPDIPDMPPQESLGLDADGVAGSDAFGLAARRGGRGIGEGGDINAWYAGQIDNRIKDLLARTDEARRGDYDRTVLLWVGIDGRLENYRFLDSSGDGDVDEALDTVIARLGRLPKPPVGMPQPIRYRIETQ